MRHDHKIICYGCREQVEGTLYIEREANPYAYVPICERCAPTWHLIRDLRSKYLLEYVPNKGVRLTEKGRRIANLLRMYKM